MSEMVPYETIVKGMQRDEVAIVEILLHYRGLLKNLSSLEIVGEDGQRYCSLDEDIMLRLEVKLINSIPKFKILLEEKSI